MMDMEPTRDTTDEFTGQPMVVTLFAATCTQPGCENAGVAIPMYLPDAGSPVSCGVCGRGCQVDAYP